MSLGDWLRWRVGRQNSGYEKLLIVGARWPVKIDLYLLKFPEGSEIPEHTDNTDSGRHFRLNIVLVRATKGGEFRCRSPIYESSRIKFFRPDLSPHAVEKVVKGTRYVLSLGWLRA